MGPQQPLTQSLGPTEESEVIVQLIVLGQISVCLLADLLFCSEAAICFCPIHNDLCFSLTALDQQKTLKKCSVALKEKTAFFPCEELLHHL